MVKKVAITGATGFVGRYVLQELLKHHVEIIATSRNLSKLEKYSKQITLVELDINNIEESVFDKLHRPDVLIHLAWDGLPNYKSLTHYECQLPSQYYFLKKMVNSGLESLLITGTCFEYGMQSGCLSEDLPTQPCNPYGYAKDSLRKQLEFLKSLKPFNLTWARLFYMYGDGQSQSSIYSQLNEAVLRGDKKFNMSEGIQLRDYLHVVEVANLIVDLALLDKDLGVLNLSSGNPVTIKNLVENWIKKYQSNIELNLGFYPYPDYEPMEFWGCNKRLRKALGENEKRVN